MNDNIWIAYYLLYINPVTNGCYNIDEAFLHWMKTGRHIGNVIFDYNYYITVNCLDNITTLEGALEHFLSIGLTNCLKTNNLKNQSEIIATYFDYQFYIDNWGLTLINSRKAAINHYNKTGKNLGYIYNKWMDTKISTTVVKSDTTDLCYSDISTTDAIILHYNDLNKLKNVEWALTDAYRCSYSRLIKILLLIKIELVRISSDLQFTVSNKQRQVIENYVCEIENIVNNSVYQNNRLFQITDNDKQSIVVVSKNSGITIDNTTNYKFGQLLDIEVVFNETNFFKSLSPEQKNQYNTNWQKQRANKLENDMLLSGLTDDLEKYEKYIESTITALKTKNSIVLDIFNNQKTLLTQQQSTSTEIIDLLNKNFVAMQKQHQQLIDFLQLNPQLMCSNNFNNLNEVSTKTIDFMLDNLKTMKQNCQNSVLNNTVNSINSLEESINIYKKVNTTASSDISNNLQVIDSTQSLVDRLFKEFTNQHLSRTYIENRTVGLQNMLDILTLNYQQESELSEINATILQIRSLLSVMNQNDINQIILNNHLVESDKSSNLSTLSGNIDKSISLLEIQKTTIVKIKALIEKISHVSYISLFNSIFKTGFFEISVYVKQTGEKFALKSYSQFGKHIIKLPYGIYLNISNHNPNLWGFGKPITIQANNVLYKTCQVYYKNRLQYEIKVDTMHLNINSESIQYSTFQEAKQSLCYIENATDIVISNFKNLHTSTLKL